jgi:penicillin amidase
MTVAVSSPPTRVRRWWRWAAGSVLCIALVPIGAVLWAYGVARLALPQLDGTLRVAGLQQRVVVTRDGHGVPAIDASNLPDLFFAQGYVTAQDRLWQMDMMRRFAEGDLAEVAGPDGVAHDQGQRILRIRQAAQRATDGLSPRDRIYFEAYTRGVNAAMQQSQPHLPIEFRLMGYTPRPWTVEDSFAVGAQLAQELNHGRYKYALLREQFLAALGPELTADLFVNRSRHDHPPALELTKQAPQATHPSDDEDDEMENEPEPVASGSRALPIISTRAAGTLEDDAYNLQPGSNNWVVSGAHTVSGKPLLSNDMHLGHQMPNLWYEAHLHSNNYDVAGVTLPGMPFVVMGHNQRIAWGFTNVEPTVEDLYIENFNAAGEYQTPQGWRNPEHRRETIHVKGAPDVALDVAITRHGPVITDLVPGETRKLALRWTLYNSFSDPFFDLNAAQNWQEFRKALSLWGSPGQNVMFADVDGHIGYQATGQYPIRAAGDGGLPVSGSDDAHEWKGYVPFEQLPSVYDPPSGVLASANGRIVPDKYPYSISTMWDAPWRTERIYRVLNSGKKLAPADMLALETDVYSSFDRACAERFVQALDHSTNLSERGKKARDLLRDWNGRLSTDSAAATIEVRARRTLTRLLLEPKLEEGRKNNLVPNASSHTSPAQATPLTWESYRWGMSSIWLENLLSEQPKRWLPHGYATYDELLAGAIEATVGDAGAPTDLATWQWGKSAPLEIQHLVLSKLPLIGKWTAPGLHDQSGGGFTVKQVGRSFGPSERFTADFADLDQSTLNVVTGQAGNFLSPHYMDQWDAWYEAHTFTLPFSKEAVQRTRAHELVLEPGS